jgi:hypothetical protein
MPRRVPVLLAPGVYVANLSVGTERRAVRFVLAR